VGEVPLYKQTHLRCGKFFLGVFSADRGRTSGVGESVFVIDNLLVRIHCIIAMIRWTGLAPWEFEFPFWGWMLSGLGSIWRTMCCFLGP